MIHFVPIIFILNLFQQNLGGNSASSPNHSTLDILRILILLKYHKSYAETQVKTIRKAVSIKSWLNKCALRIKCWLNIVNMATPYMSEQCADINCNKLQLASRELKE